MFVKVTNINYDFEHNDINALFLMNIKTNLPEETLVAFTANNEKGKELMHGGAFVDKEGNATVTMRYYLVDGKPPSGTFSLNVQITGLYNTTDIEAAKKWVGDIGTVIPSTNVEGFYDIILKDNIEVEYTNPDE
jgi:hypothetical protein